MKILLSTSLFYYCDQSVKYNHLYKNIVDTLSAISNYKIDLAIYYDQTVPKNIIEDLKKHENVFLILKNNSRGREGCFWRYEAYDDFDYDVYFFRDIDIGLESNDQIVLDNFIKSNKKIFYIFLAHQRKPYPNQGFIMGGMFGVKNNVVKSFDSLLNKIDKKSFYGADEIFLSEHLYKLSPPLVFSEPRVKNSVLSNDFYKKINLPPDFEEYIQLSDNYKLNPSLNQ